MKVTRFIYIFIEVTRINPLITDGGSKIFFRFLSENVISLVGPIHFDIFTFKLLALDHKVVLIGFIVLNSALHDGMTM